MDVDEEVGPFYGHYYHPYASYLNRLKAYRLAEIYNRPEKIDISIEAIKKSLRTNDMAQRKFEEYKKSDQQERSWLYTPEMIKRIR